MLVYQRVNTFKSRFGAILGSNLWLHPKAHRTQFLKAGQPSLFHSWPLQIDRCKCAQWSTGFSSVQFKPQTELERFLGSRHSTTKITSTRVWDTVMKQFCCPFSSSFRRCTWKISHPVVEQLHGTPCHSSSEGPAHQELGINTLLAAMLVFLCISTGWDLLKTRKRIRGPCQVFASKLPSSSGRWGSTFPWGSGRIAMLV